MVSAFYGTKLGLWDLCTSRDALATERTCPITRVFVSHVLTPPKGLSCFLPLKGNRTENSALLKESREGSVTGDTFSVMLLSQELSDSRFHVFSTGLLWHLSSQITLDLSPALPEKKRQRLQAICEQHWMFQVLVFNFLLIILKTELYKNKSP